MRAVLHQYGPEATGQFSAGKLGALPQSQSFNSFSNVTIIKASN
jgi:hypothetical protein